MSRNETAPTPDRIVVTKNEIVVTGWPEGDDEGHNCDAMGCSSIEHVLVRVPICYCNIGFTRKEQPHE